MGKLNLPWITVCVAPGGSAAMETAPNDPMASKTMSCMILVFICCLLPMFDLTSYKSDSAETPRGLRARTDAMTFGYHRVRGRSVLDGQLDFDGVAAIFGYRR